MDTWIVTKGEARPLAFAGLPPREDYGTEWIVVEAIDEAAALSVAEAWDASQGGIPDMALFAAGYRAGAFGLPDDALVGIPEIAQRLVDRRAARSRATAARSIVMIMATMSSHSGHGSS